MSSPRYSAVHLPHIDISEPSNRDACYLALLDGCSVRVDIPDGVKVWSDPPNATCDICFIHGLTGDREKTWTAKGQSTPWPKTLLPQKLQQARILTYGYDAYVVSKSTASSNRLSDHAANLLADLTTDRQCCNASSRPLIFVAHSLGGLVCKQAILMSRNNPDTHFQDIFDALKGVIFMGTPHKGAWMANWAKIPAAALGFVKSTNVKLLDVLERDNELVQSIQSQFMAMIRQVRDDKPGLGITCFFEELPTDKIGALIVSRESATFDGYLSRSIHADHRNMVKFATAEDNGFKRVFGELSRWVSEVDKKRKQYTINPKDRACLRDLYTTDPRIEKRRIERVKGRLLENSYRWIFENDDFKKWRYEQRSQLLWIKGDPGKGKTMLLCGIVNELKSLSKAYVVFFFCQATDARINHATAVLRGLIYMLVDEQPNLISHVRRQHDKTGKQGYEDANAWETLSNIFSDILEDPDLQSTCVIIDALDECIKDRDLLLDLVAQKSSVCTRVKWLVSSRSLPDIEETLELATQKAMLSLELNEKSVSEAVTNFIRHKVWELTKQKKYTVETSDAVSQHLFSNAHGTFLWVALVCQELAKAARWKGNARSLLIAFPPGLESLYTQMIKRIHDHDPADAELCKRILGVVLLVYRPITLDELLALVDIPEAITTDEQYSAEIVGACGSFLTIREGVIFFVHQSAKDFLLQSASKEIFPRGIQAEHHTIFFRSLQSFKTLRRDIYVLKSPGFPIDQVRQPDPDPLAAVRYSCIYWVDHLQDGYVRGNAIDDLRKGGPVEDFLKELYLFWLEAISLMRHISEGITVMVKLDRFLRKLNNIKKLAELVRDACRFIQYHRLAIECSPLQVYTSSLIFTPARSMIKSCYQSVIPYWVLREPVMEDDWSPCLQILEGHSEKVRSIAWSQDGRWLASGSNDHTIRIWDPVAGRCISTLKGHSDCVTSIKWSQDGSWLASVSDDETVRIWDPAIGQCISTSTIEGYRDSETSIVSSRDRSRLASATYDNTIKIWNLDARRCVSTFKGHSQWITSITWSQDGRWLASGSIDKTIKIWDLWTKRCISTLSGHSSSILSTAWSRDNKYLASGSILEKTIKIWDLATGRCTFTLGGHRTSILSIAWSSDGNRLASGSGDGRVMIWNPNTGQRIGTLQGHNSSISSIEWSRDGSQLASGSDDKTIRIWDPATKQGISTLKRHEYPVSFVAWSQDGSRLASAAGDGIVMIWNPDTGRGISTLEGHSEILSSFVWSRDGSRVASVSDGYNIRIWDTVTGRCILTLWGHIDDRVLTISWSGDGSQLASGSSDGRIRTWNLSNGWCISTLEGHMDSVSSISWSGDGSKLASGSNDGTIRIWDLATERCASTLEVRSLHGLRFDEVNMHHLHTDVGVFDLRSSALLPTSLEHVPPQPEQGVYGSNNDRTWITFGGENILRIPSEYQPRCLSFFAKHETTTVAIGCSTGHVLFLTLSNDNPISYLTRRHNNYWRSV
ncbi:hypothetical protein N7517_004785 [Penicillium concentricum]|uniref:Mitochondrial division protein 1 n=1 Tax=Penicillium concentricum TaxID=293559 RepID=A0A9W9S889_9EURO|nr:uncharacterized protein N7517_004785 [Penicillium concentricum]KAJ5372779.1 hypothetical protein N7517_004785 [Penicillium concentricum]